MDHYDLKIINLNLDNKRRIVCISDIHGGYNLLINLLKKINYSKNDYLFVLGDLIEKGPDNLKVVRYLMELQNKNDVFIIMGNNDLLAIDILYDQYLDYMLGYTARCHSIYHDMAKEIGISINKETDFLLLNQKIRNHFEKELNFLSNLPTIIETDNLLFAHASITNYHDMKNLNVNEVLKYDTFMSKDFYFPKRLIVGHYPAVAYNYEHCSLKPVTNYQKNITSIDGGYTAKIGGQLNAFILENEKSMKESYDYVDDLPKALAINNTKQINPSILGIWDRESFIFIEKKGDYSLCIIDGKKVTIPNDFVYLSHGKYFCADYTNEEIGLKKGEIIGVVSIYNNLAFIKKGDVLGFTSINNIKSL